MKQEMIKNIILYSILIIGILILFVLIYKAKKQGIDKRKFIHSSWITFVTDFWDNIGIGCFAPQTYLLNKFKITSLKKIPGSLNVGYIGATIAEAFLSLTIIEVDMTTLLFNVISAIIGSFIGSKIIHLINEDKIRLIIGYGLLVAAITVGLKLFHILPETGALTAFTGVKLWVSTFFSLLIGIGISFGIGNFAPTLAVFLLLGFDPKAVFPIMMIAAAYTSIVSSYNFIKNDDYEISFALSGWIFGLLGVIVSGLIIFNLPAEVFKGITFVVIILTSISILTKKSKDNQNELEIMEPTK